MTDPAALQRENLMYMREDFRANLRDFVNTALRDHEAAELLVPLADEIARLAAQIGDVEIRGRHLGNVVGVIFEMTAEYTEKRKKLGLPVG